MDELKLKQIIESVSKKMLDLDIFHENGVTINGNSTDRDAIRVYTSYEGYDEFQKALYKELKNGKD